MASAASVEAALRTAFPGAATLSVEDVSGGCGASFSLRIVDEAFAGVAPLARQRRVHAALGGAVKAIHALEIKAWTPAQAAAAAAAAMLAAQ